MLKSLLKSWNEILEIPGASWVIWVTVLIMLVAIAWWAISWIRGVAFETPPTRDAYLGNIEQMHTEGLISDDEYQRLKETVRSSTSLPDKLPDGMQAPQLSTGSNPKLREHVKEEIDFQPETSHGEEQSH